MVGVDDGFMPVNAGHRRADGDDDAQVSTFVTTSSFTTSDRHSSFVTETVISSKITLSDSSTSDSRSSSSSKSSSTSSSSGKSSSTSSGSSSSSSSSATSTSASTTSTSSRASATGSSTSASASSLATLPSNTASTTSAGAKPTSSNTSSIANSSPSKSLSTGAIVGISAGGGALLLLILIYFVRKRFLHRRDRRLDNYILPDTGFGNAEKGAAGGGFSVDTLIPEREPSIRKAPPPMASYANSQSSRQQYPVAEGSGLAPGQVMPPGGIAPGQVIPPAGASRAAVAARGYNGAAPQLTGYNDPPAAMFQNQAPTARYNTPPPAAPYANYGAPARTASPALSGYAAAAAAAAAPPARTASPAIPASLTPSHGSSGSVSFALVRNAFLPNLPDELAVGQGEMVRVLAEYDDGWALCQNMRGEQGAVPLECLQRQRVNVPGAGGARNREDQLAFVPAA